MKSLLKPFTLFLVLGSFSQMVQAEETNGLLEFYRPTPNSSEAHFQIKGQAARSMFQHLSNVKEITHAHGEVIRKGNHMECVYFSKETTPYFRCYFNMSESGFIKAGY